MFFYLDLCAVDQSKYLVFTYLDVAHSLEGCKQEHKSEAQ